jgi:alpha-galactosidase
MEPIRCRRSGAQLWLLILSLVVSAGIGAAQQPVPLAPTPPMGWNSWNHFREKVSAEVVRAQAQAMVKNGMKAAGYRYVSIDDGWAGRRDAQGFIHPNAKFPDMKALADDVHRLGLKFGIYTAASASR